MRLPISLLAAALLAIPAVPASAASDARPQIVNGTPAAITDAPWQVALMKVTPFGTPPREQFCGGSVLSATWVVTAAHCVDYEDDPRGLWILAGTAALPPIGDPTATRYAVDAILVHPSWQSDVHRNDIALLRLRTPLPIDGVTIAPIAIPEFPDWPAKGTPGLITGWGDTNPDRAASEPIYANTLQKAQVEVLAGPADATCGNYEAGSATVRGYDPVTMLCAGTTTPPLVDSCQADSGGPLAIQRDGTWYLAGIVSWGQGCSIPGYPGLYARVTTYAKWIRDSMQPGKIGSVAISVPASQSIHCAYLYRPEGDAGPVSRLCSDGGTSLTLPLVSPGRYLLQTTYLNEYGVDSWYSSSGARATREEATPITVKAGPPTRVRTGAIIGSTLRIDLPAATASIPAETICVDVHAVGEERPETTSCKEAGATSILVRKLPVGEYQIDVVNNYPGSPYADGWYAGSRLAVRQDEASVVRTVTSTTLPVAMPLQPGARISGRVSGGGSDPVYTVEVYLRGYAQPIQTQVVVQEGTFVATSLLPGSYLVSASHFYGLGLTQWWQGASGQEEATPIAVAEGAAVTGIDLALPPAGAVTGVITGPGGAAPEPDAELVVSAWRDGAVVSTSAVDPWFGIYFIGYLSPGSVRVQITDRKGIYAPAWYGGGTGTPIDIVGGKVSQERDISLELAPRVAIEGTRNAGRVVVSGSVVEIQASTVTPWVRMQGAQRFVAADPVPVRADGTFRWTLKTGKAVSVYVTAGDVTSTRVRVSAR